MTCDLLNITGFQNESPKKGASHDDAAAAAAAAAASSSSSSETLADEMSLCLTLLSRTTSHVFAIIEQLPGGDDEGDGDGDGAGNGDGDGDGDAYMGAAAQATSALQEATVHLHP